MGVSETRMGILPTGHNNMGQTQNICENVQNEDGKE